MSGLFYNSTVAVLRPPTVTNRAGEDELSYAGLSSVEGVDRAGVQVRPVSQSEVILVDRAASISDWLVQTEPGTGDWDVLATDWLRLPDGDVCSVIGDPARPTDPLSAEISHVQIRVRRAHG